MGDLSPIHLSFRYSSSHVLVLDFGSYSFWLVFTLIVWVYALGLTGKLLGRRHQRMRLLLLGFDDLGQSDRDLAELLEYKGGLGSLWHGFHLSLDSARYRLVQPHRRHQDDLLDVEIVILRFV